MKLAKSIPKTNRRRAGVSLLEVLITASVASIVFAAVGSLTLYTARSFVAMGNYGDLDKASRNALDTMSRDIRQCRLLQNYTPNKLTLLDNNSNTLVFEYQPSNGQLTRKNGGTSTVLLQQCDYLNFNIYQRNPSNAFMFYPIQTNITLAKLIDVSWRCSRKILGQKVNTESVQTAKIVIRN
jgi:type II secretory pathway component PulJ